jgi:hypothetical protein
MYSADNLLLRVLTARDNANRLAVGLNGIPPGLFGEMSLSLPSFSPPELGFIRAVSWLYVLYYEAGRVGTRFLANKIEVYSPLGLVALDGHVDRVGKLRTYLQHNLDFRQTHDRSVQATCEDWIASVCGSRVPATQAQWRKCVKALLHEAIEFLDALLGVLRSIESDESREAIVDDWKVHIERYHPAHKFDELIVVVSREMGRDALDAVAFRKRFYDKWTSELRLLSPGYAFDREARKLIESALLTTTERLLPITGEDIMAYFQIAPGRKVGELLAIARKLYDTEACSATDLLPRIAAEISSQTS